MGNFLEDLKNSLETGDFNSESAKKITGIVEASEKNNYSDAKESLEVKTKELNIEPVDSETIVKANKFEEEKLLKYFYEAETLKTMAAIENLKDKIKAGLFELAEIFNIFIEDHKDSDSPSELKIINDGISFFSEYPELMRKSNVEAESFNDEEEEHSEEI